MRQGKFIAIESLSTMFTTNGKAQKLGNIKLNSNSIQRLTFGGRHETVRHRYLNPHRESREE